jgi:hypothetical protein
LERYRRAFLTIFALQPLAECSERLSSNHLITNPLGKVIFFHQSHTSSLSKDVSPSHPNTADNIFDNNSHRIT